MKKSKKGFYTILAILSASFISGNMAYEYAYKKTNDRMNQRQEEFMEENQDILVPMNDAYDAYVDAIAEGIAMADMNKNIMDVFAAYLVMQHNGFLSYGNNFTYANPYFEYDENLGISIPTGEGVCRNQAENLHRVLESMGYNCGFVAVESTQGEKTKRDANHAVVWVEEDGIMYLLDPTNKTVFVRNFFGSWVSLVDESHKLKVILRKNTELGLHQANMDLYRYSSDDYTNEIEHSYHFETALKKAEQYIEFFAAYEKEYLESYEIIIQNEIHNYRIKEETKRKTLI